MKNKFDFAASMKELEEINRWFQEEEIDLDVGLEKLKRGKEIIAACRSRLKNVENEFVKINEEYTEPTSIPVEPAPVLEDDGAQELEAKPRPTPYKRQKPVVPLEDETTTDDDDLPF